MHIHTTKLSPTGPVIGKDCEINATTFGPYVEIGEQNRIDHSTIDAYTYTGQYCFIQNSQIGKFCSIASMVRIGPTDHPYSRPAQHLFAYNGAGYGFTNTDHNFLNQRRKKITSIGHDVWIGHGATIQAGVTIGNGAVIGSGAVVTKDVAPYTIVGGIPAKFIKDRFANSVKSALATIQWWNWSRQQLEDYYDDFRLPIDAFIEKWQ